MKNRSGNPNPGSTANSTTGSAPPDNTSPIPTSSSKKEFPIGAVVGGVLGALIVMALVATPFCLRRRAIAKQKPKPFIGGLHDHDRIAETDKEGGFTPVTPFMLQSPPPVASKHLRERAKSGLSLGIPATASSMGGGDQSPLSAVSDPAMVVMAQEMRRLTASVQRLETGIPEARDGGPVLQRPPAYGMTG